MNYKAAANCDSGGAYRSEDNVSKLLAAQADALATQRAMQTMGRDGIRKGIRRGAFVARRMTFPLRSRV